MDYESRQADADSSLPEKDQRRRPYELLAVLPLLLAVMMCVGTATRLAQGSGPEQLSEASMLAMNRADYSRGGSARFAPLDRAILADVAADAAALEGLSLPQQLAALILTETPAPLPSPSGTAVDEATAPASAPSNTPAPTPTGPAGPAEATPTDGPPPTATTLAAATATPTPSSVPASPTPTDTPVASATATPTPAASATATPTPSAVPAATATATPAPTATNTSTPTVTPPAVPTDPPTPTASSTPLPTATNTPTPSATPVMTPTPSPTPRNSCAANIPPGEPNIGLPNGVFATIPCGGAHVVSLGIPPIVLPHSGPDLVYYEVGHLMGTISMDWVIVEVKANSDSNWTVVFNWGDGVPDTNSNVAVFAAGGELDNEIIPTSALYGAPPYQTGITLDLDAILPPGTYDQVRIWSPFSPDGSEVDALLVIP